MCQDRRRKRTRLHWRYISKTSRRQHKKSKERLSTATRNNTNKTMINRTTITRKYKREEKQLYGHFKRQTNEISYKKNWTWPRKGNLKRKTESFLITPQNNAIWANCVEAKIDKTQQNIKCRLRGDRYETINHIIIECSKLAQKEGVHAQQNLSWRIRRTSFSGILRYERIS